MIKSIIKRPWWQIILASVIWSFTSVCTLHADHPTVKKLIQTYCIQCHGEDTQEADLRLDTLKTDFADSHSAGQWIEVMDNLNLGTMPPQGEDRPPVEMTNEVTDWIADQLRQSSLQAKGTGGRILMRRLNRTEYANIVRDLLAVEFLPGEGPLDLLPPDGTMNGFDTVSKALLLDPSLMEKYFDVAAIVAEKAIVVGPPPVPTRRNRMEYEDISGGIAYIKQSRETIVTKDGIITMSKGMRSDEQLRHPWNNALIPIRGRYRLRLCVGADPKEREALYIRVTRGGDGDLYFGKVPGTLDSPEVIEVERAFDVPGSGEISVSFEDSPGFTRVNYHYSAIRKQAQSALETGDTKLAGRLRAQLGAQGFPNQGRLAPETRTTDHLPRILFDWIELEGPLYDQWPPQSTQQLFHHGFQAPIGEEAYAREIFTRLLPCAYRRPVTDREINRIVQIVRSELDYGEDFPDAVRSGLTAMLCSPSFLLIDESSAHVAKQSAPVKSSDRINKSAPAIQHAPTSTPLRPLSGYELAFRLSRFLWSSIPDETLNSLAESGELHDSATLIQQVRRMLKHPNSNAIVDGFARQWLKADEFDRFAVDRNLYREFYQSKFAGLNDSINAEPIEFFRQVMRENKSLLDFLDSDWTMANETLAKYYGIPGVVGPEFRMVKLPSSLHRGGLTTMAAVHKWGSDGNRTKPVERGKYVLDVLFNDPPKPPPPNVGEVEPNVKGELLTVRQRLDKHRTIATCANCHRTIDPYGIALENFNVVSRWRTKQDGERPWWPDEASIDASGRLPNGTTFQNVEQYRAALRDQSDRFLRGFSEKLFTYAMGRIVEPSDRTTIDQLVQHCKEDGTTLRSLIEGIVLSETFLTK